MKSKADSHNHLRTSSRQYPGDFNKAIDLASVRLGTMGIFAMTNFEDKRYEGFINLPGYNRCFLGEAKNGVFVPSKEIIVVKGEEVATKQGHLLTLGLPANVHLKPHRSLEDTIKEAQDNGNTIIIADHPFDRNGIGNYILKNPSLVYGHLDAIELFNGETSLLAGINTKTVKSYRELKKIYPFLGALSSSDGHSFYELGKNWTEIDTPNLNSPRDFIASLKYSIKRTDLSTTHSENPSIIGAIDHILDLIWICKIAPKLGLGKMFDTNKPTF